MIYGEGIDSLNPEELKVACQARGIPVSEETPDTRLREQLRQWLDLSVQWDIPPSLLILSQVLMYPSDSSPEERLAAAVQSLPEEVCTATRADLLNCCGRMDYQTECECIGEELNKVEEERAELAASSQPAEGIGEETGSALTQILCRSMRLEREKLARLKQKMTGYEEKQDENDSMTKSQDITTSREQKGAKKLKIQLNKMIDDLYKILEKLNSEQNDCQAFEGHKIALSECEEALAGMDSLSQSTKAKVLRICQKLDRNHEGAVTCETLAKAQSSMKYRGSRVLPPSVAVWLEQQLEERGIDSFVYTRCILTLLQDQSGEPTSDLPTLSKTTKRISKNWKNCNFEELNKSALVSCLSEATNQDIEGLVDELCNRLKEVNSSFGNCLKEKTNSEDIFNLELPVCCPDSSAQYTSAIPALNKENIGIEGSFIEKPVWSRNICRALGRRRDSESSPKENKIIKRKEGKENAKARMRSRSTVKSQCSTRSRSGMAKSLDRSEKGRKCLFAPFGAGLEDKGMGIILGREEFENLPMDFQSLLQSPENNPKQQNQQQVQQPVLGNFIQCGTNITSSIWSSEKMEEEESVPWEEVGKYVGWSDARNSLLSSAWKLPFAYENFNNNNSNISNNNNYRKEDIEGTALALKNEGAFFSLFNDNSNHLSLLNASNLGERSDIGKEEPSEQLENLLTSMKTHFKPIKQESVEVIANNYNDGSSFFNLSCYDEVKYRRSESGTLFLGPDQKYMEFKRNDLTVTPEFIPKFRVCSNEKFCQTDDLPSDDDESSVDQNCDSEFFFPGDDHYAEEVNDAECARIEVRGWVTTWPVAPASDDIWSNTTHQPWVIGENENWSSAGGAGRRDDYTRLRHEITQEGEQLLSDIRYLLQDPKPQNVLLVGSSGL